MSADPLLLGMAPAPVVANAPRSQLLAGLLTLLCPGLGHFYCGELLRSGVWSLAPYLALLAVLGGGVWVPSKLPMLVVIGASAWALVRLVQVGDAVRIARRKTSYRLKSFNAVPLYLAFFLGTSIFTSLLAYPFRAWVLEPFKVPSDSMEPSLKVGDEFFVIKAGPESRIRRGDVIVYVHPDPQHPPDPVDFVKRVVGLPGDRVEVRDTTVLVNGVAESKEQCPAGSAPGCFLEGQHRILLAGPTDRPSMAELTVPPSTYFVLGDNRNNSLDSRHDGPVAFGDVVGRAAVVWLSLDGSHAIRWDRIGLRP